MWIASLFIQNLKLWNRQAEKYFVIGKSQRFLSWSPIITTEWVGLWEIENLEERSFKW